MLTILFETHATSVDNEAGLASGRHDAPLSLRGEQQARELGERCRQAKLQAVFCSDLKRSYRTAEIAFAGLSIPIIRDPRLSECDYGELTRHPRARIMAVRRTYIDRPFPGGESYRQAAARMKEFLSELCSAHGGGAVLLIGHRATQHSLEHWLNDVPLSKAVTAPWEWQPGWTYRLDCAGNPNVGARSGLSR